MDELTLIKCGTRCKSKLGNTDAIVTSINIRFSRVQYELSYVYHGEHKTVWMDECEFETTEVEKVKIGYK